MDKKQVNNSNVLRFVEGLRLTAPNTVSLLTLTLTLTLTLNPNPNPNPAL